MNPQEPVAMLPEYATRILELEGLLAAAHEDLALTRGLLEGTRANLEATLKSLRDREAALELVTEECANLRSSLEATVGVVMCNRLEFNRILSLTRAAFEMSAAGVKLRGRAVKALLAAIETRVRLGLADDEQD